MGARQLADDDTNVRTSADPRRMCPRRRRVPPPPVPASLKARVVDKVMGIKDKVVKLPNKEWKHSGPISTDIQLLSETLPIIGKELKVVASVSGELKARGKGACISEAAVNKRHSELFE